MRGRAALVVGSFVAALVWAPTASAVTFSPAPGSPFVVGGNAAWLATGDFNEDNDSDLAFADQTSATSDPLPVFLGVGNGAFSAASGSPFTVGNQPQSVAVGDFNGDNHLDLTTDNGSSNNLSALLGDGHGGFSAASGSPFALGVSPAAMATGDFNGDNKLDVIAPGLTSGMVAVLLGNGSGGFSAAPGSPFATSAMPLSVAVGNFDGDGHLDFALADSNNVDVFLGNGSGAFTAASASPFPSGQSSGLTSFVATGDFNQDGHDDIAAVNDSDHSVSVLLGNGSGGFTAASGSPFSVGTGDTEPQSVAVGDLNSDGHPDLATANAGAASGPSVSVLLGNGSGGFSPAGGSPFSANPTPQSIALADFNGDGHLDIATANGANHTASVLLNAPPDTSVTSGPTGGTRSTSASFTFGSVDSSSTFQCQLDGGAFAPCASPVTYSGLAAGSHTFQVRATNDVGLIDPTPATQNWTVDLTSPPTAALSASANSVLTGNSVTLDASASHDLPGGSIVDYQWDTGDGNFSHDTGSTPTFKTSFSDAGTITPRVRVTNALGGTAIASVDVDVRPAPPPGNVGVSVDNGDYATNSPSVQLSVVWPKFDSKAKISNDGGFNTAGTVTVPLAASIPWTLLSEGSERIPKTVYLRFDGQPPNFTDDIILDTTTPVIDSASSASGASSVAAKQKRSYRIRLQAREKLSGISAAAFSKTQSKGTTVVFTNRKRRGITKLSKVVSVKMTAKPRYVRVRSAAGNWSKWHRIG